jgi:hypothetical protein
MENERRGDSGPSDVVGGLVGDAHAGRAPQGVFGLFHVPVEVAEVDDARSVGLVEVYAPKEPVFADHGFFLW